MNDEEQILQWEAEAEAVIEDIKSFVNEISVARNVPPLVNGIYINLKTAENKMYCIEMSSEGFRVVGNNFDEISDVSENSTPNYETPYSLLASLSPSYNVSFGNKLREKLTKLQDKA